MTIAHMGERQETLRTAGVVTIAVVAGCFALYFGREFFQPVAIALLLTALFRPVVRVLEAARVPTSLAAAVIVLGLIAVLVLAGYVLAPSIQRWFANAPAAFQTAELRLNRLRRPVQQVTKVATEIQKATNGANPEPTTQPTTGPSTAPSTQPADARDQAPPGPRAPTWVADVFGTTTQLLTGIVEVVLMLYLLLASGRLFVRKLLKLLPLRQDKEVALKTVGDMEHAVVQYLSVTLLINLGQGAVVFVAMSLLKMPHPILWGILTVVLEFVPYLGAAVMVGLLTITAAASFDALGHILLPPAAYLLITTLQNNVVSPIAYGNRLKLNPVAVLIGVLFWWFLWGIPGAFVAVPILATIKIIADRTEQFRALGEFLGE